MNIHVAEPVVVPLLDSGDVLTSTEFERRYVQMPDGKAELVEGVVYMGPPVGFEGHAEPHGFLMTWLATYMSATPGVRVADNATLRLDRENVVQPDALLFVRPECGGRVRVDADDYLSGPPEFVAEVSASTVAFDRGPKRRTFLRHGVREYLLWRTEDRRLEWHVLRGDRYDLLVPGSDGLLKSEAFPGLWLDGAALLAGDLARVLSVVQQGLASDEHARFVEKLRPAPRS